MMLNKINNDVGTGHTTPEAHPIAHEVRAFEESQQHQVVSDKPLIFTPTATEGPLATAVRLLLPALTHYVATPVSSLAQISPTAMGSEVATASPLSSFSPTTVATTMMAVPHLRGTTAQYTSMTSIGSEGLAVASPEPKPSWTSYLSLLTPVYERLFGKDAEVSGEVLSPHHNDRRRAQANATSTPSSSPLYQTLTIVGTVARVDGFERPDGTEIVNPNLYNLTALGITSVDLFGSDVYRPGTNTTMFGYATLPTFADAGVSRQSNYLGVSTKDTVYVRGDSGDIVFSKKGTNKVSGAYANTTINYAVLKTLADPFPITGPCYKVVNASMLIGSQLGGTVFLGDSGVTVDADNPTGINTTVISLPSGGNNIILGSVGKLDVTAGNGDYVNFGDADRGSSIKAISGTVNVTGSSNGGTIFNLGNSTATISVFGTGNQLSAGDHAVIKLSDYTPGTLTYTGPSPVSSGRVGNDYVLFLANGGNITLVGVTDVRLEDFGVVSTVTTTQTASHSPTPPPTVIGNGTAVATSIIPPTPSATVIGSTAVATSIITPTPPPTVIGVNTVSQTHSTTLPPSASSAPSSSASSSASNMSFAAASNSETPTDLPPPTFGSVPDQSNSGPNLKVILPPSILIPLACIAACLAIIFCRRSKNVTIITIPQVNDHAIENAGRRRARRDAGNEEPRSNNPLFEAAHHPVATTPSPPAEDGVGEDGESAVLNTSYTRRPHSEVGRNIGSGFTTVVPREAPRPPLPKVLPPAADEEAAGAAPHTPVPLDGAEGLAAAVPDRAHSAAVDRRPTITSPQPAATANARGEDGGAASHVRNRGSRAPLSSRSQPLSPPSPVIPAPEPAPAPLPPTPPAPPPTMRTTDQPPLSIGRGVASPSEPPGDRTPASIRRRVASPPLSIGARTPASVVRR